MNYSSIKLTNLEMKTLEIYNRVGVLHLQALGSILHDGGAGAGEGRKGEGERVRFG